MGKFVHEHQRRTPAEDRVHIQLGQHHVVILDLLARQDFQSPGQFFRFGPFVGLDVADDHINALLLSLMGGLQHGIGLAHARGVAQEDLQLAPA